MLLAALGSALRSAIAVSQSPGAPAHVVSQPRPHARVVFVRHGQSAWNADGRFTGWCDVELTPTGREEAVAGAREVVRAGIQFDIAFTSELVRAQETQEILLRCAGQTGVPVVTDWRLNERHCRPSSASNLHIPLKP